MGKPINIDDIMDELRDNVNKRKYPKEAMDFKTLCPKKEQIQGTDFFMGRLNQDIQDMNENYYVDFERKISGRFQKVKQFVRRLYQFHMKPMWDSQNYFNVKAASAVFQLRNFVCEQKEINIQMEEKIMGLEKTCREQEFRIAQLERKLSEEK